jgi:hypothetical protein
VYAYWDVGDFNMCGVSGRIQHRIVKTFFGQKKLDFTD